MAGIFDILRAAAMPAVEARTGYLQGKEEKRERELREAEERRRVARQQHDDAEEQRRYEAQQARQREQDQRQSILDQHRTALEDAQADEARDRGSYYRHGGARGFRGSGANGELTPKDRAGYIRMKSMPHYNPDTMQMEPGMSARDAAAEFDEVVLGKDTGRPSIVGDGTATAHHNADGSTDYVSPVRRRNPNFGALGGNASPPASRPDTATKTVSPLGATRDAMAGPRGMSAADSALAKKDPAYAEWLRKKGLLQ